MPEALQEQNEVTSEIRTAARHTTVYGLGAIAVKAVGFLMLPVYTRYLTTADYGILEILDLSMSLVGMFLGMGLTAAVLRYYGAAKSAEEKNRVLSTSLLFVVATGALMFLVSLFFVPPVSAAIFGPHVSSTYLMLSFSSFVLGYIANVPRTYLRAIEASGTFVILDTVGIFAMLVINIVFVVGLKLGVAGILWSSLIVNAVWMGAVVWMGRLTGLGLDWTALRRMLGFGLPLIFSNLALFALNFSDRFFLKHFQSLDTVGIYSVGYKFGYMMNFLLIQPFLAMWQARMYIVHNRPDHGVIYGRIFVLYAMLLTYSGLVLSIFSPELFSLMVSREFRSGHAVIPVVVLAYVMLGVGSYVQLGMFLQSRTSVIGTISACAAVLNLVLNYILIRNYGMMGAAWATAVSFWVMAAASYVAAQRVLPLPLHMPRVAAGMGLAVVLYLIARSLAIDSLAVDLVLKTALVLGFPVLLWKGRILSGPETETIASLARGYLSKAGIVWPRRPVTDR